MFKKGRFTAASTAPTISPTGEGESSRRGGVDVTADIIASRSRASSIFSTGTKTSINTLPQGQPESHSGPIDVVLGRRNFRITARPGSILSISSFDHPAPPYSETIATDASQSTATLHVPDLASDSPPDQPADLTHATPVPRRPRYSPLLAASAYQSSLEEAHEDQPHVASSEGSSRSQSPPSPPLSPLSNTTNAISAHYTSVVRTIDANHRTEIEQLKEEHAGALAQIRNDIDAAYRVPFREARDRADRLFAETEALKQRAEEQQAEFEAMLVRLDEAEAISKALEAELLAVKEGEDERLAALQIDAAIAVERARNEVEDLWEGRWRDRMRLASEEIQRAWQHGRARGLLEGREQSQPEAS